VKLVDKTRAATTQMKATLTEKSTTRKRLRGPANLQYAIADSIALLDKSAWNAIVGDACFFMSANYLEKIESVLPLNISPRYALIYNGTGADRQPIAAMVMQIAEIHFDQVRPEKASAANAGASLSKAKKWLPTFSKIAVDAKETIKEKTVQRILTCGNLLTFGQHGISFAQGSDPKLAWHGVAEVLYRVRQAEKLVGKTHFVMIKDLHAPFTQQATQLEALSYRYVETEPNMVLALRAEWKTYDDYLASLASKYRANIKNGAFKPIDEAGCTVEHITGLAAVEAEFFALYKSVQVNADFRPIELQPSYFAALEAAAGAHFRCTIIRQNSEQNSKILGFLISVMDGETAIAYHIGFDRDAAGTLPIYLRLLHASVADAIALGAKRVSFGRTALEPKAALGAKPQTFGVLLRHRQPVLNKLMKRLLLGIEHDEAPERNPFKKT
jgi:hypothetical protein